MRSFAIKPIAGGLCFNKRNKAAKGKAVVFFITQN